MMMPRLLGTVPAFREQELVARYKEIERNFRERRWEPAELNGGKLSEVVYCILKGHVDGAFPPKISKPNNFYSSCVALEGAGSHFGRSVRIQIPRMLIALYEIRNNRNVGHVGGDVDPNVMDAVYVLHMAKWVVSELVRIFHSTTLKEASDIVESLSDRQIPVIWELGVTKRILDTSLTMLEKTLVLLYSTPGEMTERALVSDVEHSNAAVYRRDVLRRAHKEKLIEYDGQLKTARISPVGIKRVEVQILPKIEI